MNPKSTLVKWSVMLLLFCQGIVTVSKADAAYCSPTFANGCFNWSNQAITLDSIHWALAASDCLISDYTSLSTTLTPGDSAYMSVTSGVWCGAAVWIDFNMDEDFDSTENLYHNYVGGDPGYSYNFYITIPQGVPAGSYRMRVIGAWGSDGYTVGSSNGWGACGSYQYGNFDDFTINIAGGCTVTASASDTVVCHGDSVVLSGIGANMTFAWDNGVSNDVAFVADSTLTYTVTGTDVSTSCTATATIMVVVNPLPMVTLTSPFDTVCDIDGQFSLSVSPVGGTLTGPGVVTGTNDFLPITANLGVNNTLTYNYTDSNSCSNSVSINIFVDICGGINDPSLTNIHLYPVPLNNYLDIDLPKSLKEITMKLFSLEGKLILQQTLLAGKNRIDMQSVSEGVYTLQLKNSMNIQTRKIVVVK